MMRLFLTGFGLSLLATQAVAEPSETVSGRARVLTGDTLMIGGRVIGLYGAAAPGRKQVCLDAKGHGYACGAVSARALAEHLRETSVTCRVRETDAFNRALAVCHKDREDLSAWTIGEGHAVADRDRPAYLDKETPAWGRRKGLWAGSFDDLTHRKRIDHTQTSTVADVQTVEDSR